MGTLPDALDASTFVDGEWVNEVKWYRRVFSFANAIRDALEPMSMYWVGVATISKSVTSGAWNIVDVDTLVLDSLSLGITSGGFSVPSVGIYSVSVAGGYSSVNSAGTRRYIQPMINGVDTIDRRGRVSQPPMAGGGSFLVGPPQVYALNPGDLLEIGLWQDSGSTLSTPTTLGNRPTLSIRKLA